MTDRVDNGKEINRQSMRIKVDKWLIIILALSVLLRVGVVFYLGDVVDAPSLLTDQRSYHALGARLIAGHGFSFDRGWYPFTPADTPTAHWSFLYSIFVAAVYAIFGVHPLAARLVQAVLGGILLPWMVFRLARRMFGIAADASTSAQGESTGPIVLVPYAAAAIAAAYGYFVLYAATLMTETFYIVTLLWSLEVALEIVSRVQEDEALSFPLLVRAGLSLGVAALLRQSILPWVPVLFVYSLWVALRHHRLMTTVYALAVIGGLLLLCILPWTYRNYRAYGSFLLLNSNTGYAMYSGQHPMHGTRFREFDAAPLPDGLSGGNEAEMDRELMRLGIQFMLDEPVRYLRLSLSRVRAFFEFWPTPDTTLLHNLGRVGSYGVFLPFMLYGLYLACNGATFTTLMEGSDSILGRSFVQRNGLLFVFVLVYTLMHLLTWAMVRYRLPIDAVMLSLAGLAFVELTQRLKFALRNRHRSERVIASVFKPKTLMQRRNREG